MKIAIGYSFLNGEKEHTRALEPWLPYVDHVIAIDGRYRTPLPPSIRQKHSSNYSTDRSYKILKKLCKSKLVYEKLYDTQMNKRQRYFDIAGELGCDYLIVWDTDDYIHPEYQNWDWFKKQLEIGLTKHPEDRIYYMWAWIPDEIAWSKQYNQVRSNTWIQYSRIYKNPATMRYAQTHWTVANKETTDQQINLWKWGHGNDEENPHLVPTTNTIDGIRFTTDRILRTANDKEFGNAWTFQQTNWEEFTYSLVPYLRYKGLKTENITGADVPMEKMYFKYQGKNKDPSVGQIDEPIGQVVLLNDDGTETVGQQQYHLTTELNEEDKPRCEKCGQVVTS